MRGSTPARSDRDRVGGRQAAAVPVSFDTHAFGQISGQLVLPLDGDKVAWSPDLVFPGLRPGERLVRQHQRPAARPDPGQGRHAAGRGPGRRAAPRRSARRGRASPVRSPRPAAEQDRELSRLGFPPGTPTGTSGLELAFNRRLAGTARRRARGAPAPGGRRARARADQAGPGQAGAHDDRPRPPAGGGGGARRHLRRRRRARRRRRRRCWPLAGHRVLRARSRPGSTFKLITTTAALEAGVVKLTDTVPDPDRRPWSTARDRQRPQRGLRRDLRRGVRRVVQQRLRAARAQGRLRSAWSATAERYGFNSPPSLYDRPGARSVDPPRARSRPSSPTTSTSAVTRDRPGRGAGDAAGDGVRRPDDRQRRRARARRIDRDRPCSCVRRQAGAGDVEARSPTTLREPDDRGGHDGTGTAAALPGHPGGGQDRDRRARPEPLSPARPTPAGARAEARRLVHRLRAGERPEARGRRDGRQRERRRRHGGGADRPPGHGLGVRGGVTNGSP